MSGLHEGEVLELPMFPLGSVLFPAMPMPLRVFEPRYLTMLQDLLERDDPEFGVALIERGQEVGGGDERFRLGTVARITEVTPAESHIGVLAEGRERLVVEEWLDDDPYPRALVRTIPDLEWGESCADRREQTELLVRRTLAKATELDDYVWPATIGLADDPVTALWQLAAIAPIGPLDQVGLLRATSARELLDAIFVAVADAAEALEARLS